MDLRNQLESALGTSIHIIRELGGGGMSRVFLAEDVEHSREIVVKVVPGDLAGQVNLDRFRREIKVAAKLQHPCIVPVLSSGSADGLPFYTMPFVEGESLRERLSRERGLSVPESTRILRDIAGAVACAHERGVVHRDIKPENILVTRHHAVLVDFGVAKALTESTRGSAQLTSVGVALGTPAYMAPEQAAADPAVDHRADIYALGVVAYEMLAGRHPFEGRSAQSMLAAHAIEQPNSVSVHRPSLPVLLTTLVTRMMEKHPGDRPQSAEEIIVSLDQVGTPTSQSATTGINHSPRVEVRRKRLLMAGGLAGAAVTIAALSMFAFKANSKTDPVPAASVLLLPVETRENDSSQTVTGAEQILDAVSSGLNQVKNLRLVSAPEVLSWKPDDAANNSRKLGAGTLIRTSIYPSRDSLQLQFRVIDANTGLIIRTLPPTRLSREPSRQELDSAIDPLLAIISFVASPILGAHTIPAREPRFAAFKEMETALNTDLTADPQNYRIAEAHFIKAYQLDTNFIQPKLWQMWLYRTTSLVRNVPAKAYSFDTLQVFERTHRSLMTPFEETLANFAGDRVATHRGVRALAKMIEWNPNGPIRRDMIVMLADLNRPHAADSAMEKIFAHDSTVKNNVAFWYIRSVLSHYSGDYRRALEAARHARSIAPNEIAGLRAELWTLAAMGDTANIEKLLVTVSAAARNRGAFFDFAGDLYLSTAQELTGHGHAAAGRKVLTRALEWFDGRTPKELENQSVAYRAALAYMVAGRLDDAHRLMKGLHNQYPEDFRYMGSWGRLAAMRGDTATALSLDRQLAELPSEKFSGSPTFERAQIMAQLGRRDETVALLAEAFSQGVGFVSYRARVHTFNNFVGMRGYPPFEALLRPAG